MVGWIFCWFLLVVVLRAAVVLWWRPRRIEEHFFRQGIRGPPYRFFIGNVKELVGMMIKASSDLSFPNSSHNILPRVLPFYHHWKKIYGIFSLFLLFFFFFNFYFPLKKLKFHCPIALLPLHLSHFVNIRKPIFLVLFPFVMSFSMNIQNFDLYYQNPFKPMTLLPSIFSKVFLF